MADDQVDFEPDEAEVAESKMDDAPVAPAEPTVAKATPTPVTAPPAPEPTEEGEVTDMDAVSTKRVKGRGGKDTDGGDSQMSRGGVFDRLDPSEGNIGDPQRSIEGWILIATGINEDAQEEDITDKFSEYGEVKNVHLNLDRRTGFVKGYALVEYETKKEADAAIAELNGSEFLDKVITVDYAFVKGKDNVSRGGRGGGGGRGRRGGRGGRGGRRW